MKITFIKVGMGGAKSSDTMKPLAFAIMAGMTPKSFELDFFDEGIEELPMKLKSDWVIMSANSFTIKRAYQLASIYRAQGILVAIGGIHSTLLPQETMKRVDVTFVGDAEGIWIEFLEDLKNNEVKQKYSNDTYPCMKKTYYDENIFKGKKYTIMEPLQYSRGCKFSCDFCSVHAVYKKSLRYRDVEYVVEEIKRRGLKYVFIVDDNLFLNREKTKAFLIAIKPLKIRWTCQISIDIATDDELLQMMVDSGCISVLIGFETTNLDNLSLMNKQANIKHHDYGEIILKLKCYGLMVYGTFVLGYDNDNLSTFDETLKFALDHKLFLANFNPLIPTIGTQLYDRLDKEGRLIHKKWWLEDGYKYGDTVFKPKQMTPEELRDGCYRIRKAFNSYRSIGSRLMDFKANLKYPIIYLGTNLISKREIFNKQGREL